MMGSYKYRFAFTVSLIGTLLVPMVLLAAEKTTAPKVVNTLKTTVGTQTAADTAQKAADTAQKAAGKVQKAADTGQKAAEVGGKIIPYKEFERRLQMFKNQVLKGKPGNLPEALSQKMRDQVINKMISDELLFQQAVKLGIKVDKGTIDQEINQIKSQFKDEEKYQEQLKGAGYTEQVLRDQIKQQASIRQLIDKEIVPKVKVEDEEVKKYYEANPEKFRKPEKVRARHILMKVEKGDSEEKKAETLKKLKKIQKRILAGEEFSTLAKENSQGPSSAKGGDLGYFSKGRMVKSFEDAAFKLAPNEVSDIVETQFGYHLIKVIDRQKANDPPFEKIENRIKSMLFREGVRSKIDPYVQDLRKKSNVQVYIK